MTIEGGGGQVSGCGRRPTNAPVQHSLVFHPVHQLSQVLHCILEVRINTEGLLKVTLCLERAAQPHQSDTNVADVLRWMKKHTQFKKILLQWAC